MKISELEEMMVAGHCDPENIERYENMLKRVSPKNRCQHCYTTAVRFQPQYSAQALKLIQYGLEQCGDDWLDKMRAHFNMAWIYERDQNYPEAFTAYRRSLKTVPIDQTDNYMPYFALHFMRMELHVNGFVYSDKLKEYYNTALLANDFDLSLQKNDYYLRIAEIVIGLSEDNSLVASKTYRRAKEMISPGFSGSLTEHLRSHGFNETACITNDALAFLMHVDSKLVK